MSLPSLCACCMALISGAIFMKFGRAPAIRVICISILLFILLQKSSVFLQKYASLHSLQKYTKIFYGFDASTFGISTNLCAKLHKLSKPFGRVISQSSLGHLSVMSRLVTIALLFCFQNI